MKNYPFMRDPVAVAYSLDESSGLINSKPGTRTREFSEREQYAFDKEEKQIEQLEADEEKKIVKQEKREGYTAKEREASKAKREEARAKAKEARQAGRDAALTVLTNEATALLVPEVMPARLIKIVTIPGDPAFEKPEPRVCLIKSVRFYGNNYGGDFLMDIVSDIPPDEVLKIKPNMSDYEIEHVARQLSRNAKTIRSLR